MLRLGLGVVLVGLIAATQAAGFDESFFAPRFNLSTAQVDQPGTDFQPSYQLSASVVLIRSSDTAHVGLGLGSTLQLPPAAQTQPETSQPTNILRQQAYDGDNVLLQRLLRLEYKGDLVNIAFRPRSISVEGEHLKITFQPQSALIEGERLKVMLRPHSATMLWGKAF